MHRRMKYHFKTGVVILAFSLLITIVFIGGLISYGSKIKQSQTGKGSVYYIPTTDYEGLLENGGILQVDANKIINVADYNTSLIGEQLDRLLPISLIFLTILFFLSICLWQILKQMQMKQMGKIAYQLEDVMNDRFISEEPFLMKTYTNLRKKFDDQLNDYKRLSSYLNHEQKNDISILRTKLELSQNYECLKILDNITDNIDDFLTLSENSDINALPVVDVSIVCAEVYDNYRKIVEEISFEYEGEENTEIYAKSRWIYRAVANLLDNAIKYGKGNPIVLSVRAKHNSVIVSVTDHGMGIEETKQENIFNNRYRINELNKDGYGIGLSLVSHVCDLCDGFVTVESEIDKGTTFCLSFPQKLF